MTSHAGCLSQKTKILNPGFIMSVQQIVKRDEKLKRNSGVRHEISKPESGPIVDNWEGKTDFTADDGKKDEIKYGTANLTLNPDGSWNFSGQMNEDHVGSGAAFNIVFAVRSSEGTVIAFKHAAALEKENPQSYSWEKQGDNRTIKENFKAFAKKHDWYVTWTAIGLPQPGSSGGGGSDFESIIGDLTKVLGPVLELLG
jgi:VCBS repeat-containing protein